MRAIVSPSRTAHSCSRRSIKRAICPMRRTWCLIGSTTIVETHSEALLPLAQAFGAELAARRATSKRRVVGRRPSAPSYRLASWRSSTPLN